MTFHPLVEQIRQYPQLMNSPDVLKQVHKLDKDSNAEAWRIAMLAQNRNHEMKAVMSFAPRERD